MNLISDVLSQHLEYKISVFTSINSSPYKGLNYSNVKIFRFGSVSENSVIRYIFYIIYNLIGALMLLLTRPDVVLVYESLSIFPAYIYAKFFPGKKIHIHYHEYVSLPEKEVASRYMKFLYDCEEELLRKCSISQTNDDRKNLFLKDYSYLKLEGVSVYPNMPPNSWWRDYGQFKRPREGGKIKLVYVGVLDAETMYLEEILRLVSKKPNDLELTILSQDISESANKLISRFQSENILLKTALDYYDLPKELIKHDIGLVLYKGHIPNYVFNVPNKVFEYLSCGLQVVFDKAMLTLLKSNLNGAYQIEFRKIEDSKIIETFKNFESVQFQGYLGQNQLIKSL